MPEAPPPGPLPKSGWRVVQRVRVPVKHSLSSVKSYGKDCVCRKVPIAERPLLFGREREGGASLREEASLATPPRPRFDTIRRREYGSY